MAVFMPVFVYTNVVCVSFQDGCFSPLKPSPSVNVSKSNNQSAAAHKAIVHNSVNSSVALKLVSGVSRNFIRPDLTSKHVFDIPSKPVKCKVACKPIFNVSSKSMKS